VSSKVFEQDQNWVGIDGGKPSETLNVAFSEAMQLFVEKFHFYAHRKLAKSCIEATAAEYVRS
jgi:hypothetical protein